MALLSRQTKLINNINEFWRDCVPTGSWEELLRFKRRASAAQNKIHKQYQFILVGLRSHGQLRKELLRFKRQLLLRHKTLINYIYLLWRQQTS